MLLCGRKEKEELLLEQTFGSTISLSLHSMELMIIRKTVLMPKRV